MSKSVKTARPPTRETIKKLLKAKGISPAVKSIDAYLNAVRSVSERWQQMDWATTERDEDSLLNNVRLVGQTWFRGHASCNLTLRPDG